MNQLKSILNQMHGKNKSGLHWLYNTRSDGDAENEKEKIYFFEELSFWFEGTGHRKVERLLLIVSLPWEADVTDADAVFYENFLLHAIAPCINELSRDYVNPNKDLREKAQFSMQEGNSRILRRSGAVYDRARGSFLLRLTFHVPLINAVSVNAKATIRAVKDILFQILQAYRLVKGQAETFQTLALPRTDNPVPAKATALPQVGSPAPTKNVALPQTDSPAPAETAALPQPGSPTPSSRETRLADGLACYRRQLALREFLKEHGLAAFIADGSILPRAGGTDAPMPDALPFSSPDSLRVTVSFADGTTLSGMALKKGVTVITGGGYSGKSTLLDALEEGIYNHMPGDGREYVITDATALKTYAEDGRPVSQLDLSPFFRFLPGDGTPACFTTGHASGSVSQAANIIEAVCAGVKLLLIDEDKSATNFMIRDQLMRKIVANEPIIPFTDRVRELYATQGVSSILVIGGSGEYLSRADTVLLMQDYRASDITTQAKALSQPEAPAPAHWQKSRIAFSKETAQPFLVFQSVETENERKIILDDYSADITLLTAIKSSQQMNTLAYFCERLLTDKALSEGEVFQKAEAVLHQLFTEQMQTHSLLPDALSRFYEEIRAIDAVCCLNRMRNVTFKS